jgi:hypothetical protein
MHAGWEQFFRAFPGYAIEVEETTVHDQVVGFFGTARGSYKAAPKTRWEVAAAWKATVEDGVIAEWRVYCDTSWTTPP